MYITPEQTLSRAIDLLRFPLAIFVIMIHVPDPMCGISELGNLSYSSISLSTFSLFTRILAADWFSGSAVPLFFFFAGLLLYRKHSSLNLKIYIQTLNSRFYSIALPFFIWSFLYALSKALFAPNFIEGVQDILFNISTYKGFFVSDTPGLSNEVVGMFGTRYYNYMPDSEYLWFLRDLIALIIISPILFYLTKKAPIITGSVLLFCYLTKTWVHLPFITLGGVFYFSMGILVSSIGWDKLYRLERYTPLVILAALASLLYSLYGAFHDKPFKINSITVIINSLLFILLACRICKSTTFTMPRALNDSTMFLYCWHGAGAIGGLYIVYGLILPQFQLHPMLNFLIGVTLITVIGLLLYYVLNKFSPRFYSLITGRR